MRLQRSNKDGYGCHADAQERDRVTQAIFQRVGGQRFQRLERSSTFEFLWPCVVRQSRQRDLLQVFEGIDRVGRVCRRFRPGRYRCCPRYPRLYPDSRRGQLALEIDWGEEEVEAFGPDCRRARRECEV